MALVYGAGQFEVAAGLAIALVGESLVPAHKLCCFETLRFLLPEASHDCKGCFCGHLLVYLVQFVTEILGCWP